MTGRTRSAVRLMPAVGLLLCVTVPADAQDHRFALTGFAGAASYSDMTLEADTELLLGSGAFAGLQAEAWLGRFGVRLNGGLASPSLADDPATGFSLLTGDVDVTYRLRWPEPGLFFQPYAAGGLGVVRYDLDPDGTTVAGEAYEADPTTRTSLMLGVGADFGRGPLAVRLELMDIIGVTSPFSQADGAEYGPVQHVVLTLGLSWRAGRIALAPRPEPTARPRPPTRVPSPTRFPPQGPRREKPEEPDTTTAPPPAEPGQPDTTGPQIRPPEEPGEKPEPVVTPVEPPPDTTARDTTPRMAPPPPTPTPTPREPPALPPEPKDTTEVPARPELPRVRRPLPPPPDSAPEDSVRIEPPDEPGEGPPVAPPLEPPDSTVTPPPSDTTSPPPDSAVTPPPSDTTPPPDTGAVHGRLFAVQASWPTDDEAAAERATALADSVRDRGLPVVRSEGRVRGRRVTLLRVGALRNAADANTLGAFVEAVYELDRDWVHIPKDEEVPAADVAASEAFVEELREQYGQGTPK